MTEVEWTPKALDLLEGLESEAQERLVKKLDEAKDWTSHRLGKLSGYPYYTLRAGDYRAIITWDRDEDVLIVEAVGHRRNIYIAIGTVELEREMGPSSLTYSVASHRSFQIVSDVTAVTYCLHS